MKPIEIISTDLFEKVRSRFTNLQIGDESGSVTADPAAARFFDFDFTAEGNTLGRVSISINEIGSLKVYYSQGITEKADSITQTLWYDFLKEMRFFAKRRLLRFDTRDITKGNLDKTDFQYLAQNGNKDPNMNESAMFGSKMTSHRKLEDTDLIIRHSQAVDETKPGARSRKIKNLFIQNAEGERFKFPFIYLPGARAMQRHIANGGYPHDEAGKHIVSTCEEILKLSDFGRKVKHSTLNDNAHGIIERAGQKLKSLRHHMECMSKQGYYESWKESYAPETNDLIELDDATMEGYKDTFTVNKFDEALADMFPLLHKIMQEAGEIDLEAVVSEGQDEEIEIAEEDTNEDIGEFAAFESWATALEENTLDSETLLKLKEFLEQNPDQTLGADGTEAIEALQGVGVDNNALEELITAKVKMQDGSNIALKDVVAEWLSQDDPEAAQQLFPPQAPAEQPAPVEAPVAEAVSPALQKAFDGWMNSEYAPMSDEYGDDNALLARASNFLHGKVPKEQIDHFAEKLVGMAYGEEDMDESMKNTDIADKSYLKTAGKKPGVVSKAVDTAKQAGKWLAGKGGPGKEGPTYESSFMGPEDFQEWLKDATHRVAHGKVADWTELYAELTSDLGFDENKAERIAQRVYGHEKLQNRVAPTSDIDLPTDADGEDDDDEFLSNLRGQARSGSIKPGVDTGGVDEEDSIETDPDDKLIEKTGSAKEIAEIVLGFYDRDNGTWTKGEHGVVTHVKRQFSGENGEGGEKEAALAAKLIQHLNAKHESTQQFAEMRKLAGLPVLEADAWKKETPWKKITKKDPRGVVTNLSDKARRETEKAEKESKKK